MTDRLLFRVTLSPAHLNLTRKRPKSCKRGFLASDKTKGLWSTCYGEVAGRIDGVCGNFDEPAIRQDKIDPF